MAATSRGLRLMVSLLIVSSLCTEVTAQVVFREDPAVRQVNNETPVDSDTQATAAPMATANADLATGVPDKPASTRPIAQVTTGTGVLPHDHNQKWREYDIRPYTSHITTTERPEQAVIDWVLRETGTEVWFTEPLGLLNASKDTLRVYHTDEMQAVVQEVVDKLVVSQGETHAFSLRLVAVSNPNWRVKALPLMRGVTVQSPGVDAWLLTKENAAVLLTEIRKRTDFSDHNSPNLVIHNGQSQTISAMRPRNYVRNLRLRENAFPAYELEMGQIQEGYSLQVSPLLALDQESVDIVIKCQIDQVENLLPVRFDVPTTNTTRQAAEIQVPQLVSWRLHERFRWPTEQVLLLSCGVVATPAAERTIGPLGLPKLLNTGAARADALLFIEYTGKASQALVGNQPTADRVSVPNNRGRY